jgi:four helix bundle protein
MDMFNFENLIVYQRAMTLVERVYGILRKFPKEEQYALCDQLRRAIVSVPSNIAEGKSRLSRK